MMRIAVTVDPELPVPPVLYGGIERVVDFLVRGLRSRGHHVTLVAHPESRGADVLIPYGVPPHWGWRPRLTELVQVGAALWWRRNEFDLVHSFGRLAALVPVLTLRRLPKIQSYQRDAVPWRSVRTAVRLAGDSVCFTGCSTSVYSARPGRGRLGGQWRTIFNGVDLAKYQFVQQVPADAPLVFLGRLEPYKGAHHAIAIAKKSGRRLVIAGNRILQGPSADYFDQALVPHLDGQQITYVGPLDDIQKNQLLGAAAAFLMPIEWEEPFGIVMAEAMACGTPVIGFARGSVPEVIREGVNGFACREVEEAVQAVQRVGKISRAAVRADCETRFSSDVLVTAYENLYREMLRS